RDRNVTGVQTCALPILRISESPEDFEENFNTAQRESVNAFADDTMYLERYVREPRHIEVQILGDKFGNVIQLGERDCSIQRRHRSEERRVGKEGRGGGV